MILILDQILNRDDIAWDQALGGLSLLLFSSENRYSREREENSSDIKRKDTKSWKLHMQTNT